MKQEKFACDLRCLLSLFITEMEVNYLCINHATKKNWELWVDFELNSIQAILVGRFWNWQHPITCLGDLQSSAVEWGSEHTQPTSSCSLPVSCASIQQAGWRKDLKAFQRDSTWIAVFIYLTSCVCVCVWQLCLKYLCFLDLVRSSCFCCLS